MRTSCEVVDARPVVVVVVDSYEVVAVDTPAGSNRTLGLPVPAETVVVEVVDGKTLAAVAPVQVVEHVVGALRWGTDQQRHSPERVALTVRQRPYASCRNVELNFVDCRERCRRKFRRDTGTEDEAGLAVRARP